MDVLYIIGSVVISIGLIFMLFGVIGLFKYKNFYIRVLVASKIDTVGVLTVTVGIALQQGLQFFSFRILLIVGLMFIINPMVTHLITRSAYESEFPLEDNAGVEEESEK